MKPNGNHNRSISLAIVPFENLSPDNGLDILCKSFSIDLTTELSRFKQFQIVASDSVQQIQQEENQRGKALGLDIDYQIKGSFRSDSQQVRINAQLINAKKRHVVWADRFESNQEDIIELQDNLLRQVVSGLQQQLNYDLLSQVREKPKIKLKAYEYWLYGMEEVRKGTVGMIPKPGNISNRQSRRNHTTRWHIPGCH